MHAQTRPLWTDWPQHLHVGWGRRRNQLCKFFLKIRQKVSELSDYEKIEFPIEIIHRPYNSVGTTVVPHCESVIVSLRRSERLLYMLSLYLIYWIWQSIPAPRSMIVSLVAFSLLAREPLSMISARQSTCLLYWHGVRSLVNTFDRLWTSKFSQRFVIGKVPSFSVLYKKIQHRIGHNSGSIR